MAQGEVSVALHLIIADALRQAKDAAKAINKEFGIKGGTGDMGAVAAGTNKAAAAQKNLHTEIVKTNKALLDQVKITDNSIPKDNRRDALGRFKSLKFGPGKFAGENPGEEMTPEAQKAQEELAARAAETARAAAKAQAERIARFNRNQLLDYRDEMREKTLKNPPPILTPPKPTGGMAGIMSSFEKMRDVTLPIGQVLASFYVISRAISAALAPLKMFAKMVAQAAEAARKLYANALMSGMGIGMTVKRNMLANILGVSENDIFQFGRQIQALNGQLEIAQQITAKTNPALATMGIECKVLEANLSALQAEIASMVAPEIVGFTVLLSKLTAGLTTVLDGFESLIKGMLNAMADALAKITFGFALGSIIATLRVAAGEIGKKTIANVGTPQAYMKQMPASAWEKMGLIVGAGGGTNYGQQTANNTKPVPSLLKTIASALLKMGKDDITRAMAIPSAM